MERLRLGLRIAEQGFRVRDLRLSLLWEMGH